MIFSLAASLACSSRRAWASSCQGSIIAMAASLAPPCSGPRRVPMAAVTQENMSESVEAQTRAAKVEALNSCSA